MLDQGPNSVPSNGFNYTIVSGRSQNAISFTSSSPSYLQASGFLALGIPNQPFSISLWIQPASLAGTLVHQSNNSLGSDFCITYLGFASNGSLIAQILTNTGYVGISYSNLSLNTYSHVVQTWSSTNGLRLYVNNILIATQTATTSVASSAWVNYVTIGSCLNGCGTCNSGQISLGQFVGAVDDFRIYIRKLTSNDVCAVYAYGFT